MSRLVRKNWHSKKGGGKDMGRIRGLVLALMIVAVAAFLGVSQAKAADLYGWCNKDSSWLEFAPGDDGFYYGVAYEAYQSYIGASSKVDGLAVTLGHTLFDNDSIKLLLSNGTFKANENVYYALVVDNGTDPIEYTKLQNDLSGALVSKGYGTYTAYKGGSVSIAYRIAAITSNTVSSGASEIDLYVDNASELSDPNKYANKHLYLAQVRAVPGSDNYTVVNVGTAINVSPGLDASCTNYPEIMVAFAAPNDVSQNYVYAKIWPKCGTLTPGSGLAKLTAELNTDTNFTTFLEGPAVQDAYTIDTSKSGCTGSCTGCTSCTETTNNNIGKCGEPQWIVGDNITCDALTGYISFTLTSLSPESGIESVKYDDKECTANSDKTAWTCSDTTATLKDGGKLYIKVDGTTKLSPTAWTITNMVVSPNSSYNLCIKKEEGDAGAWYGGLEAIVPFVKSGDGYETYIKLFNRYDKDADVYAATFKDGGSGSMIVALKNIGTIPANGELEIKGSDIAQDFNLTSDQIAYGIPVKFMILVPSGKGCLTGSGETFCNYNPNDPYVEGIVVSVTPQGQRSIPLEFKYFKNGSYVQ